jgi:hypothetical protein
MPLAGSTIYYAVGPGQSLENVIETATATGINSGIIVELYVSVGTLVTDAGAYGTQTSRQVRKAEVLQCLEIIKEQITRDTSGNLN